MLTDMTIHQGSVHKLDEAQYCGIDLDRFQSHRCRVRIGQGLICQANIKQLKMKLVVFTVADNCQEMI
jgi:hypothetical protein